MKVTAVTVNWLTTRRTLGAIWSFRQFYPDIPLIVVDDASSAKDKTKFFQVYYAANRNPSLEYDPDPGPLKNLEGVRYIQGPDLGIHPESHGACLDLAAEAIEDGWMFHFHSDYRLIKPGLLEELLADLSDYHCGAGVHKISAGLPVLENIAAIYNVTAVHKFGLSFQPAIIYDDGTFTYRPSKSNRQGKPLEASAILIWQLQQLGYQRKLTLAPRYYGVHLRWTEEGWSGPF